MRTALVHIFLLLALLPARHAAAEDLVQVYDLAHDSDASLRAARALVRSAEPRAAQANALLLPSANATTSATNVATRQSAVGGAGAPGEVNLDRYATRTATGTLNVRVPLFNRVASVDIAKARVGLTAARTEFDVTEQEFIVRVAQAYFDVLSAQDVLATTRSSKTSIGGQLNSAQRNFDAGTGIITDVRDAQARYDLVLSQEIAADNELRVRSLMLDRLVGRRGVQPRPLAAPSVLPAVVPEQVDAWMAAAASHPSILRARLALESAGLDIRRAQAERLPTVAAVGSVTHNRYGGSGAAFLPPKSTNTSVGLELNMPLFAGFAVQNRIAEALLLEEKAREDLESATRSVEESTQRAFFDLQSGRAQVKALEAAELSGRLSLQGTEMGYRAGVRLNLDVLNAQTLLFQTRRDLAKARYDVLMGFLKLRLASGQLSRSDLLATNGLLAR
ncbi:MAG: TolC family outer membrane protein [Ramlibacter sp.]|nr:TolC family outer membrane protein [Ramlibacter sp.]